MAIGVRIGAGLAVLAGAAILSWYVFKPKTVPTYGPVSSQIAILFRNGIVVDSTESAADILDRTFLNGVSWAEIKEDLSEQFPDLPDVLPNETKTYFTEADGETTLTLTQQNDSVRLEIKSQPLSPEQAFEFRRKESRNQRLEAAIETSPNPIWEMDQKGAVIWHNPAYAKICKDTGNTVGRDCPFELAPPTTNSPRSSRVSLPCDDGSRRWYEVSSQPYNFGWMHFACSIDNLVEAEMAQRNFVQTLTKTFAHLPIGLAVFDRERRLVLFNPALVDLTHLPVDFLSSKPNLLSFFDHMRENRMMPEPKNYSSWKEKLTNVVSAAREDRYCETWTLPSGLTYKITGRPHPDGAVAFLIEDISAEISLTRRFRSELELTQSVIDCFSDSVAVFSRLGVLTFSNSAYRKQWKCDPDSAFAEITIVDATKDWQAACEPSPIWSELREFVLTLRDRSAWTAQLALTTGEAVQCHIEPVAAGATMVKFTIEERALIKESQSEIVNS